MSETTEPTTTKPVQEEPEPLPAHPTRTLSEIRATKVDACVGCPLYDTNVRVPSEHVGRIGGGGGIMVIGEAPGMGDYRRPYMGAAGDFIRGLLDSTGMLLNTTLDNAVKCRPFTSDSEGRTTNETPRVGEIRHCARQLRESLRRERPKLIVTLGEPAFRWFVPNGPPRQGQITNTKYGPVLSILHPAAVLRSGSQVDFDTLKVQLRRALAKLDGTYLPPALPEAIFVLPPKRWGIDEEFYKAQSRKHGEWSRDDRRTRFITWDGAVEIVRGATSTVMDLETTGRDPYREDAEIISCSFAVDDTQGFVFPTWHRSFRKGQTSKQRIIAYKDLFKLTRLANRGRLSYHNSSFDMRYTAVMFEKLFGKPWKWKRDVSCTLVQHWMLEPNSRHGLDVILTSRGYESHKRTFDSYMRAVKARWKERLDVARDAKKHAATEEEAERAAARVVYLRDVVNTKLKDSKFDYAAWGILGWYNALDSALTFELQDHLDEEIRHRPHLRKAWLKQLPTQMSAHNMELTGLAHNPPATIAARERQQKRVDDCEIRVFSNPWVVKLLVEDYGFPVDGKTPLIPSKMAEHLKLTSAMQMSKLFFGAYTKSIEGEKVLIETAGLGIDRKLSKRNANGYATNKEVLAEIIGSDWDTLKQTHPFSDRIVNDSGETEAHLGGVQLLKAYKRGIARKIPKMRALNKIRTLSARAMASDLIEHRNAKKFMGTYIDGLEKRIGADGMLRDEFKVHGTVTGRWASFVHTFPRDDKTLKRQVCSRWGDDGVIMGADQGQIELRGVASLADDEVFLDVFNTGRDPHKEAASAFWSVPLDEVTKEQRTAVKAITFGTIYRRSPESLAIELVKTGMPYDDALQFAKDYQVAYFDLFKGVYNWRERILREVRRDGISIASEIERRKGKYRNSIVRELNYVIITPFGRELQIPRNTPYGELSRLTSNYPVQSAAGDITNQAAMRIERRLVADGFLARLILPIHDAVYVDSPKREVASVANVIREEMLDVGEHTSWLRCPLATDIEVGPTLGDLVVMTQPEMEAKYGLAA